MVGAPKFRDKHNNPEWDVESWTVWRRLDNTVLPTQYIGSVMDKGKHIASVSNVHNRFMIVISLPQIQGPDIRVAVDLRDLIDDVISNRKGIAQAERLRKIERVKSKRG